MEQKLKFPKHGDFRIRIDGQIVTSELAGPWNIEAARDYIQQLDALVTHAFSQRRWGSIVICRESIQFPLEMIAPLRTSIQTRVAQFNQVAVAMVVAPDVEGYGLLFPIIRGIYEGVVPFELFDTLPPALSWMSERLNESVK